LNFLLQHAERIEQLIGVSTSKKGHTWLEIYEKASGQKLNRLGQQHQSFLAETQVKWIDIVFSKILVFWQHKDMISTFDNQRWLVNPYQRRSRV
jgi:hypothetical protein